MVTVAVQDCLFAGRSGVFSGRRNTITIVISV